MSKQIQGDEMHPFAKFALPLLGLAFTSCRTSLETSALETLPAQERDRNKIAEQYKWNLTDIYPSDEAWKEAKQKLIETTSCSRKI